MYPVVSVVAPAGESSRDRARESGVGEEIVLRKIMSVDDGTLREVVRIKGPAKFSMLVANPRDLGNS